ncbi:MAG: FKBP-type peptidyl-prolyl cis-trans isomerase [Chitinophagales bacterium]|nr:FKBP-type peptidyl-prolyl cis-trans isomerase [Chitinophagales bacterium]MCZ2392890.1 FKBP-type peptidyl-prolyl cis-trans isomerase [Chitinophagales bacterium]
MTYNKIILFLLVTFSIYACKNKPKKSIGELATQVETFTKETYLDSQLDSLSIHKIKSFGSEIDTIIYSNEIEKLSSIVNKEKHQEIFHTNTGVIYMIEKYGSGDYPENGDILQVNVETSTLENKKIFSTSQLKQPLQFVLGVGQVVPAWDEVFVNIQEGSRFQIFSPSALSYGKKGFVKSVAPNTILKYDITFDKIIHSQKNNTKNQPKLDIKEEKGNQKEHSKSSRFPKKL